MTDGPSPGAELRVDLDALAANHRLLTRLAGHFAAKPMGGITTSAIRRFVVRYGVDMAEAAQPDIGAYTTFNDFFTRALKPGARPIATAPLCVALDRLPMATE